MFFFLAQNSYFNLFVCWHQNVEDIFQLKVLMFLDVLASILVNIDLRWL